jgi:hypothetical protein
MNTLQYALLIESVLPVVHRRQWFFPVTIHRSLVAFNVQMNHSASKIAFFTPFWTNSRYQSAF